MVVVMDLLFPKPRLKWACKGDTIMSECKYFGLSKTCKYSMSCRGSIWCHQHPEYYKEMARVVAAHMQAVVGKKVRAYKDIRKFMVGNICTHGKLIKVFVRGNSVAYKVRDDQGNTVTCSYIEEKLFQD
jgi:hypothetical protein